jgi:3-oxoacyl-[acyl-carrier protein] reductase
MSSFFQDKVVLVTGSGRGIGEACAKLFASQGARLVLVSRTQKELEKVATEIRESGGYEPLVYPGDISQEIFVQSLFQETAKALGEVDVLVNNAAIFRKVPFEEQPLEQWQEVMRINVRGSFLCAKEAFKHMKVGKRGGSIVNISSLAGIRGTEKFPGLSSYTVSKFAVIGLTESIAVEGKPHGIRANCIAPGAVKTRMLKEAAPELKTTTKPEDIAKTVLYLCDDTWSGHLTGSLVEVFSNS